MRWVCMSLIFTLSPSLHAQSSSPEIPAAKSEQQSATQSSVPPDSTDLVLIKKEKALYPLEAAKDRLQGQVIIKIIVSETGDVEHVEIESGNPVLAEAALQAVKKYRFRPFIRNGKAVKVSTKLPFDFAYSENIKDIQPKDAAPSDTPQKPPSDGAPTAATPDSSKPTVAPPLRVRVSQGVTTGLILHKVQPVYPPAAKAARIQGTVLMRAVISKEGIIKDLSVISGPKELEDAAVGAVQQWRYRPYLMKGEPVEVETTITVIFSLRY
jgi:TonB family protein